ncbi:hypothetical protein F5Y13DRAFT_153204 [Hypoxylon sp. FL1857]|nr:hypothetical protein F5Y13DRAFT_153204 [Hypoxylon sp. FL1857]
MCFIPWLNVLIRSMRRRKTRTTNENTAIPLEPISPMLDDIASLEGGMLYTTRNIRVETFMIRSATAPTLRWTFHHPGPELETNHT